MTFWGDALLHATYLYNRIPHSALVYKTPYELKNSKKPDISNLRTFGSIVYYKIKGSSISKLDSQSNKAILIGIGSNIYRIYDITLCKKLWVRDIKILENQFYNFNTHTIASSNATSIVELPIKDYSESVTTIDNSSTATIDNSPIAISNSQSHARALSENFSAIEFGHFWS